MDKGDANHDDAEYSPEVVGIFEPLYPTQSKEGNEEGSEANDDPDKLAGAQCWVWGEEVWADAQGHQDADAAEETDQWQQYLVSAGEGET